MEVSVPKRRLTKKQREFVNEYAQTGNGVQSALKAYDSKDYATAASIAAENLKKPQIVSELVELGFDTNTAKRVVGEILSNKEVEPQHRLKAADLIFKVHGDFAPEKSLNLNIEVETDEVVKKITAELNEIYRGTSPIK